MMLENKKPAASFFEVQKKCPYDRIRSQNQTWVSSELWSHCITLCDFFVKKSGICLICMEIICKSLRVSTLMDFVLSKLPVISPVYL